MTGSEGIKLAVLWKKGFVYRANERIELGAQINALNFYND